jgi:hypothetical protein
LNGQPIAIQLAKSEMSPYLFPCPVRSDGRKLISLLEIIADESLSKPSKAPQTPRSPIGQVAGGRPTEECQAGCCSRYRTERADQIVQRSEGRTIGGSEAVRVRRLPSSLTQLCRRPTIAGQPCSGDSKSYSCASACMSLTTTNTFITELAQNDQHILIYY